MQALRGIMEGISETADICQSIYQYPSPISIFVVLAISIFATLKRASWYPAVMPPVYSLDIV